MLANKQIDVLIILGSASDLLKDNNLIVDGAVMKCVKQLRDLGISYDLTVASCHRSPIRLEEVIKIAEEREIKHIIAAGGMAFALPGIIATKTQIPVLGLPLGGDDALMSISQLPDGSGVALVGIGKGKSAAIYVARVIATSYKREDTLNKLENLRALDANSVRTGGDDVRFALATGNYLKETIF